jgi:SpoVK/Ycf46/Vps4 family AAA+-type ATPase
MVVYKNVDKYVDESCKSYVNLRENASIKMCFGNQEKEKVWNSVIDFFNIETKKHFRKFNQPYKTAYLIHGPTGTGKTELLFQLVSFTWKNYQKPLFIINPTGLNDTQLEDLFNNIQTGFVLVDEWDLFLDKENHKNKDEYYPSLNCWLNILDRTPGEIIFWFTTNNFQNLAKLNDGALIRPGRIDHIHKFDKMNPQEARNALNYFIPDDKDLKSLKDSDLQGLTISHIVNHLKNKLPITTLRNTF